MGQCSRRCWLACVWCAHGAWAAEFHCGASRWENACRGASAHSRARCAHCAWCMVGRVALRRIIWCAHVLEPQHSTVMHLGGGDASAAEASAHVHSARRMTRTYGQLNAGGRWLYRMKQHTPPTAVGVRSAMTCHPLQNCRSGCVANINLYTIGAGLSTWLLGFGAQGEGQLILWLIIALHTRLVGGMPHV